MASFSFLQPLALVCMLWVCCSKLLWCGRHMASAQATLDISAAAGNANDDECPCARRSDIARFRACTRCTDAPTACAALQLVRGWGVAEEVNALSRGMPGNTATADAGAKIADSGQLRTPA